MLKRLAVVVLGLALLVVPFANESLATSSAVGSRALSRTVEYANLKMGRATLTVDAATGLYVSAPSLVSNVLDADSASALRSILVRDSIGTFRAQALTGRQQWWCNGSQYLNCAFSYNATGTYTPHGGTPVAATAFAFYTDATNGYGLTTYVNVTLANGTTLIFNGDASGEVVHTVQP